MENIRLGTNGEDVENAILGTFLFLNDLAANGEIEKDMYELNLDAFTSEFRKRVAERINRVEDEAYSFLSYEIENSAAGTRYETDFLNLISQNSLTLAHSKKYHDDLVEKTKIEALCS